MTLYEQIINSKEGLDICDTIYDYGTYYDFNIEEDDSYSLCMKEMAKHIDFKCFKSNWYSQCEIAKFMFENQKTFNEFMNKYYNEEYRPKDNTYSIEDEEFYDVYIDLFNMLVRGTFDSDQYTWLRKKLEGGYQNERPTTNSN